MPTSAASSEGNSEETWDALEAKAQQAQAGKGDEEEVESSNSEDEKADQEMNEQFGEGDE